MSRSDPEIRVRLPSDVKQFVDKEALVNGSSRTSEVVRAIRERMKTKGPAEAATSPSHDQNPIAQTNGGVDA